MTDSKITERMLTDIEELAAMRDEELHPDLAACIEDTVIGPMIKHPMIYDILPINGYANRRYAQQKRLLSEAEEAGDWHTCVFLHERPYRLQALIEYVLGVDESTGLPFSLAHFESDDSVAEVVASVWTDSENIHENIEAWMAITEGHVPGTPLMMGDQAAFDALPDIIEVWRGDCPDGGWSWSTQRHTAEFFAKRWDAHHDLLHGLVNKRYVFGYLPDRGEAEVMVRREHVINLTRQPCPHPCEGRG